jgi:hypothetical protein
LPPRYVYWTIVIDGAPTAFRAASQEELLPTLRQIQRKTPQAVMKWFARGRIWESPEEARLAYRATQARRRPAPHRMTRDRGPARDHRPVRDHRPSRARTRAAVPKKPRR